MTQPIRPAWPAHQRVHALVTTRQSGDPRALLPADPVWLKQEHGTRVINAADAAGAAGVAGAAAMPEADAAIARVPGVVCAVKAADCMPVLLADQAGSVVGAAHAGWRGLAAGVIEATLAAMGSAPAQTLAWLGPAIGPRIYEVGEEVREAFLARDSAASSAFVRTRAGHWLLDLYAVARQRLAQQGVQRVYGGEYCTYSDAQRFFSWRRDRTAERMVALIWLT